MCSGNSSSFLDVPLLWMSSSRTGKMCFRVVAWSWEQTSCTVHMHLWSCVRVQPLNKRRIQGRNMLPKGEKHEVKYRETEVSENWSWLIEFAENNMYSISISLKFKSARLTTPFIQSFMNFLWWNLFMESLTKMENPPRATTTRGICNHKRFGLKNQHFWPESSN